MKGIGFFVGSFLKLCCFPIKILKEITLLTVKYHDKKRAALSLQSEGFGLRGKIRLLGFFRKQQPIRKQPFCMIDKNGFVSMKPFFIAPV
jgi:hypothetical protein